MTRRPTRFEFAVVWAMVVLFLLGDPSGVSAEAADHPLPASADSIIQGVVWHPPRAPGPALRQLGRIDAVGATAVRLVGPLPADRVFSRADTLGLTLFLDLPVDYVSASALEDSLEAVGPVLRRLRRLAGRHPSVRAIGLARGANTTAPTACPVLREWASRVQEWPSAVQTYYVTPFTAASDRCRDAVDRILLDTRGHSAPVDRWAQWDRTDSPPGLGALGTWVEPTAGSGLRVPHSAERQARYLEQALGQLLRSGQAPPPIFVYRWQDRPAGPLLSRHYALRSAAGEPRPAAHVVKGFYRGTQRVFAFPDGTAPADTPLGSLVLGWIIVALLGGLYARNPFVRQTLSRYFQAHGFYRDAVREGREVNAGENALLAAVVGTAIGVIGTLAARIAAAQPATEQVLEALPSALRTPVAAGLSHPAHLGLVVGGVSLGLLLVWSLLLVVGARFNRPFSVAQGTMLVIWPCWPAVFGMIIALVAATDPPVSAGVLGLVLLGGGVATIVAVSARVLRDYGIVSGLPLPWIVLLALPSPLVLLGLGATVLTLNYDLPLGLLWHLLTRT